MTAGSPIKMMTLVFLFMLKAFLVLDIFVSPLGHTIKTFFIIFQTNDLEIIQFQFFIKESAASFSIKFCA